MLQKISHKEEDSKSSYVHDAELVEDNKQVTYQLEVLRQPTEITSLVDEWHALLAQMERVTCFSTPEWLLSWWEHFGMHSHLYVIILRALDSRGTTLVGIVPLQIDISGHFPFCLRVMRWLGQSNGALTDTVGAFFAPGYAQTGMREVLAYLHAHRDEWDMLALARTSAEYTQALVLWTRETGFRSHVLDTMGWLSVQLPDSWERYQSMLSKNLRSNLPRYRNRLMREGYQAHFIPLTEAQDIRNALPQFFALHRQRAQAEQMKQHSDYFAHAESRAFLTHIVSVLAEQQQCVLMRMIIDGQVVAMQLLLICGRGMSLYFSGFDPAWSRYSVMMLTTRASIEYAISQGYTWIDLTAGGGSQAKRQWGNEERMVYYVVLAHPTLRGYISLYAMRVWHYIQNYLKDDIGKLWHTLRAIGSRKKE